MLPLGSKVPQGMERGPKEAPVVVNGAHAEPHGGCARAGGPLEPPSRAFGKAHAMQTFDAMGEIV